MKITAIIKDSWQIPITQNACLSVRINLSDCSRKNKVPKMPDRSRATQTITVYVISMALLYHLRIATASHKKNHNPESIKVR
jgi:hypothetical protein